MYIVVTCLLLCNVTLWMQINTLQYNTKPLSLTVSQPRVVWETISISSFVVHQIPYPSIIHLKLIAKFAR